MNGTTIASGGALAALVICALASPAKASIDRNAGATAPTPHSDTLRSDEIVIARGGGGRGGGGGMRGGGGGMRGGGGGMRGGGGGFQGGGARAGGFQGGSRDVRGTSFASVNNGARGNFNGNNFNRNNVNRNNFNRNGNRACSGAGNCNVAIGGGGYGGYGGYGGWDDGWVPGTGLAIAGAAAATAAVVGSVVNTVPSGCGTTVVNGYSYYQCGSTWYQPTYAGDTVQYTVINPPQ